ncbi:hypothetical protein QBC35DRAFT_456019 [Podospora australis]|uniref:Uncharacterized protein n=1 Tax=Podospora australis TaxID=1536484 RepID=A0AAN6WKY2_9PEZI|nr:hypothetical protein QBC35DRAFT_456019 [Podospora australis]
MSSSPKSSSQNSTSSTNPVSSNTPMLDYYLHEPTKRCGDVYGRLAYNNHTQSHSQSRVSAYVTKASHTIQDFDSVFSRPG